LTLALAPLTAITAAPGLMARAAAKSSSRHQALPQTSTGPECRYR
jgi:hypothetical protein